ncbi:hypothetical protein EDD36DRAFT_224702 [Exophiala viscosa]|uniref:EamA domain-containing protein n=1 Tax=Exophiala viscosa TaxID=2486360 RepID=A0AAN6E0K7_9EURO|nr:hypothetical protein EDD36DRAFT_224702 [Exophiala viscosa]
MTTTAASDSSDSTAGDHLIYTPSGTESPLPFVSKTLNPHSHPSTARPPSPVRLKSLPSAIKHEFRAEHQGEFHFDTNVEEEDEEDEDEDDMSVKPSMHRPTGPHSHVPLLAEDKLESRGRPDGPSPRGSQRLRTTQSFASHRSTFRSRSPSYAQPKDVVRRKYMYASFFLVLSLASFVVQTETAVYIQHDLGWDKAYCMMYLTHGSWIFLWPIQLAIIRIQKRKLSWAAFWRRHVQLVTTTAQMVESHDLGAAAGTRSVSPWSYMIKTTAFITTFLTMAGGSWYVAVNLTSPSDLTAIYNCSAFFAYVFSIMLLHDKLRFDKALSVGLAIVGVLVVAYGDKEEAVPGKEKGPGSKLLGNVVIGIGSVAYGFYEVLYKRFACPPEGTSPGRGMIFANTFGSMVGLFTLCVLWIPLPILHFTGLEKFEFPTGRAAGLLAISTLSNAVFSGSFLVLMSLTSPVLSSVAALLTIFLVAITDWIITGKPLSGAAMVGGALIVVAFAMLSFATYKEMKEEERAREEDENKIFDDEDEDEDDGEEETDELGRRGS